jgi:dihydrofolate reductase
VLLGRTTYVQFANLWPGRDHPWTNRLNAIKKYVFSSTLQHVDWENSVIVRGNVEAEVTKLKQQDGGDMLVYGHGQLAQTLLKAQLLDVLDLAIHPVLAGSGGALIYQQVTASMELVAAKTFSNIVKLSYEPNARKFRWTKPTAGFPNPLDHVPKPSYSTAGTTHRKSLRQAPYHARSY